PAHRRACGAWWSAHLVTAPALAPVLPGSTGSPFPGAGGVLVSPDHGRIDLRMPVQLPSRLRLDAQGGLDPGPGPIGLPTREPLVDRLPGSIALGQVPPGHPGADPEQDAVEARAVIPPPPTALRCHRWQQRRQPLPLLVGDLESPVMAGFYPILCTRPKLTPRS